MCRAAGAHLGMVDVELILRHSPRRLSAEQFQEALENWYSLGCILLDGEQAENIPWRRIQLIWLAIFATHCLQLIVEISEELA